jgi:hypothetical protein
LARPTRGTRLIVCQHGASRLVSPLRPSGSACQHGAFGALSARLGPFRPSLSACQLLPLRPSSAAHEEPLLTALGSTLVGTIRDDLAEMLRSRRAERGGVLTSEGQGPKRADGLYWQIPGIIGKVGSGEGVAPGEKPSALFGERACLCCGLFESGPQLMQERRSLPV